MASVTKRDYYEILGIGREAGDHGDQAGLSQAGAEIPSRPQSGRSGGGGQFQGSFGGVQHPERRTEARRLRPLRPRGPARQRQRRRIQPRSVRRLQRHSGRPVRIPRRIRRRRRQRRSRAQRGEDLRYDLEIAFEEAMFGMSAEIQVPRMEACGRCKGSGSEPGTSPVSCPTCHGRGEVIYQQSFLSIRRTCSTCNGTGQVIRNACSECRGNGAARHNAS